MTDGPRDLVTIGRVIKAHGIHGEVVVDPLTDVPGRLDAGVEVFLDARPRVIERSRPHQGRLLIVFDGVGDRTAAELLRGRELQAPALPEGSTEHFLVAEIVGLDVHYDGALLGTVTNLIELPPAAGYDLLEVTRPDGSLLLLPDVDEHVAVVERPDGGLYLEVIDPPEGLIDGEVENAAPDAN